MIGWLWVGLALLGAFAFRLGQRRALALTDGGRIEIHSLPAHYGQLVLAWAALPPLLILVVWTLFGSALVDAWSIASVESSGLLREDQSAAAVVMDVHSGMSLFDGVDASPAHGFARTELGRSRQLFGVALAGLVAVAGAAGLTHARRRITPELRARNQVERIFSAALMACSVVAILTTIGIVLSLFFEAIRFFQLTSPLEFFFGTEWSPQTALRSDQVGSSGSFGAVPVFAGTLLITAIAMSISIPVGLMSAIYLAFYAGNAMRAWVKPVLEIIAGIPTVVWGSFAALTLGPQIRGLGEAVGLDVASESALAAGMAMGVMIIPFVSSMADDSIAAVPQAMRDGSLAMGATTAETIRKVLVPAALPGIVAGVMLAISRAIGETMIVVMAAGASANLTANPFESMTTVTFQIVAMLTGEGSFDHPATLSAFALGMVLFLVTLALNFVALRVVKRYREAYE